ncbi:Membrane protein TerC, possibly involved in tellurium resistance [Arboricoccus pini]|uniref:Membrane protein TerC, possibly involved in tellurium resistance n=1 Tax=Arboricoccus pini TaxID=1963835 RepID=A0A212PVT3_9PROT|nr:TerC family protein [Arboricoccus pini]SNB51016.1 Membrane protein TerC, possibly involved in tellurium resistance [Arboricoccus pini]
MEAILDPGILAGLTTLIVLEVVLGIDNLLFIAVLADKLPAHQRDKARLLGLGLALILLAGLSWIIGLTQPVLELGPYAFSWRDLILVGGGFFLLIKATLEIHERLEGHHGAEGGGSRAIFWIVIVQILALDAVFSLDSIITAVGMIDQLWVMMTAVIVAMTIMIAASRPLTSFVGRHPTVVMLCLGFLLLIGFSLLAEGFGYHVPKGYLYAAIGFSILIEFFNQMVGAKRRRTLARLPMRLRTTDAVRRLLGGSAGSISNDDTISNVGGDGPAEFGDAERAMIEGVFGLAEKSVVAIMTPCHEIFWIDADRPLAEEGRRAASTGRTRCLVGRGSLDRLLGMVETKEVLSRLLNEPHARIETLVEPPLIVHDRLTVIRLIDLFRETGSRFAVVVDEHGAIEGIVTSTDIFAAIAGDLAEDEQVAGGISHMGDGTILVEGQTPIADVAQALNRPRLGQSGRYATIGGYLLWELGRMPKAAEVLERDGIRFSIETMERRRIGKVLIRALDPAARAEEGKPMAG